jgi:phytoene dehydrogenase-like protein
LPVGFVDRRVSKDADVIVVGGGAAGRACARVLAGLDVDAIVLESSDAAGGRIRSDFEDGYVLDRGFQVLLTSYPGAQRLLDFARLEPGELYPGALVWAEGRLHRVADPFRRPLCVR